MERLIEGIQDYEKYKLLQEEYAQKGKSNQLHRLQKIISQFTLEELNRQGAAGMVATARKELNGL
jgi:hypothetical protein